VPSPSIIRVIKSKGMRREEFLARCAQTLNAYLLDFSRRLSGEEIALAAIRRGESRLILHSV
jgi:hypothetical protein